MGALTFLREFFDETEEELMEEIKEAEKTKAQAEKKLRELKRKKGKQKKSTNKKLVRNWLITFGLLLLLAVIWWGVRLYGSLPEPFKYECKEMNSCKDCLVAVSCPMIREDVADTFVYFTIKNLNELSGNCDAQISIVQGDSVLFNQTRGLGRLEANETKVFKMPVTVPDGTSKIGVAPNCEWG